MVPLNSSRSLLRSVLTVSHSFLSQVFGHLTSDFRPWILDLVAGLGRCALLGSAVLDSSSSSGTGGLMSCRLWGTSCCWTSLDWLYLLFRKYLLMQGPCSRVFMHFFHPWCILRPTVDVTLAQPQLQRWSLLPRVDVVCSIPKSTTVLSAEESSSTPTLVDSMGIFFLNLFVAINGWDLYINCARFLLP